MEVLMMFVFVFSIMITSLLSFCVSYPFTSFVFGDSLVDAGNNDYIFTLSKADLPPYGIDFKPSGGQPTGRFTNGRTTADIVGESLGADSFPPPYLAPNTTADAIYRGINYASGASGILDETGSLFLGRVSLRTQVDNFERSRAYMVNMNGENGTKEFLKKGVFSLTTGSNDILNYVQPSIPFFRHAEVSPSTYQDLMVSNFTAQLKRLHELGARKFVVANVGPLGCIPFTRALNLLPSGECSVEVNNLIQGYNRKLSIALQQLNYQFRNESVFVYANSYDIFARVLLDYRQYGFDNGNDPCCGGYFPPFVCFKGQTANKNSSILCDDRSKYVFWDAYHPTEAANIIIARDLVDGDESISFPINIRALYNYDPDQ